MADTNIAKHPGRAPQAGAEVAATEERTLYLPDVDISENGERIRLLADMPGVDQDSVDVTVENNELTLEGRSRITPPEGCERVGRECGAGRYRRVFALSDAVKPDGIKARMRNGLLEVTIPKREEVKTRKIEITN
jgi:HSP20 family protein